MIYKTFLNTRPRVKGRSRLILKAEIDCTIDYYALSNGNYCDKIIF